MRWRSHRSITLLAAVVLALAAAPSAQAMHGWLAQDYAITEGSNPAPVTFVGASSDTQTVAFTTADSLSFFDTDAKEDLYTRQGGLVTLLTSQSNPLGAANPELDASATRVLPDGAVLFKTTNRIRGLDTDSAPDYYVSDGADTPKLISAADGDDGGIVPTSAVVSADGSSIAFTTTADLLPDDTQSAVPDVYRWRAGTLALVTRGTLQGTSTGISADGSRVWFESTSDEGGAFPDDDAGAADLFSLVAPFTGPATSPTYGYGTGGESGTMFAGASPNGATVVLRTHERFGSGPPDTHANLYADFGAGLVLLGGAATDTGAQPAFVRACDDGSVLFMTSQALAAGDTDSAPDVYRRAGNATTLMTPGVSTAGDLTPVATSADCHAVLWATTAQERPNDTDSAYDLYSSVDGAPATLISAVPAGGADGAVTVPAGPPQTLGSAFLFTTTQTLDPGDGDGGAADVYEWDRASGIVSFMSAYSRGDGRAQTLAAGSPDGLNAVVATTAGLPSDGMDPDGANDLYRYTLTDDQPPTPECSCVAPPTPAPAPKPTPAPAPDPTPKASIARPKLAFTTKGLAVKRSGRTTTIVTRIKATCPAGAAPSCTITLSAKLKGKAYATRKVTLKPGQSRALTLTLSSKAIKSLAKARKLRLAFAVVAQRAGGADVKRTFSATVKAPRKRR